MSIALLFWVLMILALLFSFFSNWPLSGSNARPFGMSLLVWLLLALLGWQVFGAAIHK